MRCVCQQNWLCILCWKFSAFAKHSQIFVWISLWSSLSNTQSNETGDSFLWHRRVSKLFSFGSTPFAAAYKTSRSRRSLISRQHGTSVGRFTFDMGRNQENCRSCSKARCGSVLESVPQTAEQDEGRFVLGWWGKNWKSWCNLYWAWAWGMVLHGS